MWLWWTMTILFKYQQKPSGLMVVMEVDEDDAFCASVPELPGCVAGGDTIEEVLADIGLALEAVLGVLREDDHERYEELLLR